MVHSGKERMRGMRVATALLGEQLDDAFFEDAEYFVHRGTAPRLDATLVERLNEFTRNAIAPTPPRGYLLARFGLLAAARIAAKTADERAQRDFVLADAYRQHLAACVGMRFITEARDSALKAKELYRKKSVAPLVTFQPTLTEMNEAWIAFYSDDVDLALRTMKRCTETLRDRFHDDVRYSITRNHYGSMLMQVERVREAAEVFVELLRFVTVNNPSFRGAVSHNANAALERLGNDCPQDWIELSRELVNEYLPGQAARSKYIHADELKRQGRKAEAVSVLYMIRAEFEAGGQEVVAAATVRAIVQDLVPLGRRSEAELIGYPAIELLERHGMLFEARRIRELLDGGPATRIVGRPKARPGGLKPFPTKKGAGSKARATPGD